MCTEKYGSVGELVIVNGWYLRAAREYSPYAPLSVRIAQRHAPLKGMAQRIGRLSDAKCDGERAAGDRQARRHGGRIARALCARGRDGVGLGREGGVGGGGVEHSSSEIDGQLTNRYAPQWYLHACTPRTRRVHAACTPSCAHATRRRAARALGCGMFQNGRIVQRVVHGPLHRAVRRRAFLHTRNPPRFPRPQRDPQPRRGRGRGRGRRT